MRGTGVLRRRKVSREGKIREGEHTAFEEKEKKLQGNKSQRGKRLIWKVPKIKGGTRKSVRGGINRREQGQMTTVSGSREGCRKDRREAHARSGQNYLTCNLGKSKGKDPVLWGGGN